jgi:hypothetical protein
VNDVDQRVHDALADLADGAPDGEGVFDRAQRRIDRARRRRVALGAIAMIAALAGLIAVLASRDPRTRTDVRPAVTSSSVAPTTTPTTVLPSLPVAVPDVAGLDEAAALRALRSAGFDPAVERIAALPGTGDVFWQVPAPGELMQAKYPVRIWTCGVGAECVPPEQPDARFTAWSATELTTPVWNGLAGRPLGSTPDDVLVRLLDARRSGTELYERYAGEVVTADAQVAKIELRIRNLPDDSSYGIDLEITLASSDGGWRIESVRQRTLCQPNRGSFPSPNCI